MKNRGVFNFIILIGSIISLNKLSQGAKILGIFPAPFKSHFKYTNAVMKSLIDAGHEITIITPFPGDAAAENYSSIIDISKESILIVDQVAYNAGKDIGTVVKLRKSEAFDRFQCEVVFNSEGYQDLLTSKEVSFDVIFVEIFHLYKCYLPIAKKCNASVIGLTTMKSWYNAETLIGNAYHPADVPLELLVTWKFDEFYYRLVNTWSRVVAKYFWSYEVIPDLEDFHQRHEDILKSYHGYLDMEPVLMFFNSHYTMMPRSMNPNGIEIGGIQVPGAEPLPEEIRKFIDEAENGVILFCLGFIIRTTTLPKKLVDVFLEAFAQLPQRVIWKYEKVLGNVPENVMLLKSVPQRDILEHKNVKAFMSHCGQNSFIEAIHTGTPVVAFPLMYDQYSNAEILDNLGVAIQLDIDFVSEEGLLNALNSIINDTRYYDKMQILSRAFKDRPLSPQQNVVFWTEYVIKYRNILNLTPPSGRLNWFQYYLLDIVCLLIVTCSCFVYILIQTTNFAITMFTQKVKVPVVSKNKLN